MKKNYLFLIATLMLSTLMFAQTVTLTPTAVNNTNINTGPINLASMPNSTISLNIKVDIPSNVAVNDYGTLKIYYSNLSSTNANVAAGGDGGALFFGGGRTATRSVVINLYWSDFLTSGGFIYAEYKNPAGTAYRSSNLAVIKNSTMNSGTTLNPPADAPNPRNITNTLCCNQTVRLGERPQPITGSKYLNPYDNEPYGIKASWETNGNPLPPNFLNVDNINQSIALDYTSSLGTFTVKRMLGYSYLNDYPNTSNVVTITVIKSPFSENIISIDGPFDTNGFAETISTNSKNINGARVKINLTILQNPNQTEQRGDNVVNVDRYEWEYTKTNIKNWKTIQNENSESLGNFLPNDLDFNEDNYYLVRRIAVYQNLKRVSNELKILVRTIRNNNTICCDQVLKISSPTQIESPESISGSSITSDPNIVTIHQHYVTYQWQLQVNGSDITDNSWQNIVGATNKDYTPTQPLEIVSRRGESLTLKNNYKYRRITEVTYSGYDQNNKWISGKSKSYSNEVSLTGNGNQSDIKIYPNPATSVINIENTNFAYKTETTQVSIVNNIGETVNLNNFSLITPYIISIDISNLPVGIYFINIQSTPTRITKLSFIKQ
ncbi:T9SS type A sorting domain-containing protein [Flavobacterium tistrianum]|uniref:T9SS type A sorting domain-containing protein n=1 Tax=Flavobacterium tistrianum TaxID=1685414 RepID=UPI000DAE79BA|nr:T9SS type A sorting domain-containing protein [Flavobacterium tistrianum]KAF2340772.1 T9SS type A sorting domain-containing protein [Flavobacterium tistrianum]